MNRVLFAFLVLTAFAPTTAFAQTLAFPGAEGFGRFAAGARTNLSSSSVYHVTNLNDSGPGSFRDAVSQPNRFVVFDVGGIVTLNSVLEVSSNLTIAGQTAPGGFVVYGDRTVFHGANNLISRHWGIHKGATSDRDDDAASIVRGNHLIFDHMSITWGTDGTFDMNADSGQVIDNLTIQNSIIGQGLDQVGHSTGSLIQPGDGGSTSIIKSLWADNVTRNPKVRGENEFINNVVYGWGEPSGGGAGYIMGDTSATSNANVEGNYFIEGPYNGGAPFSRGTSSFHIYANDNWVDTDRDGVLDGTLVTSYPGADVVSTRHNFPTTTSMTAQQAVTHVAQHAGMSIFPEPVNTRIREEVLSFGTLGGVIERDSHLFPGYATLPQYRNPRARFADADNDGIADNWEAAHGLSSSNSSDWKNLNGGYTQLEQYVNELGADGVAVSSAGGAWTSPSSWTGSVPTLADEATVSGAVSHAGGHAFARRLHVNGALIANGGTVNVFDTATVDGAIIVTNAEVSAGRVLIASAGQSALVNLQAGSVLRTGTVATAGGSASLAFDGGTFSASAAPDISVSTTLNAGGGVIDTGNYSGEVSGSISGVGGFTKRGSGELELSGTNSYSGPTIIDQGTLKVSKSAALGNSSLVEVRSGTVLDVGSAPGGYTTASGTTVMGAGAIAGDLATSAGSILRPAGQPATTEAMVLTPDADTYVRFGHDENSNYGTSGDLVTRQNDTAPRDYMAYVRFDLSSIATPITDAMFTATKSGGDTLVGGRVRILGLNDDAGNTDQDWSETDLTWNNLGAEVNTSIYPSPTAGASPLDLTRITDMEQGVAGITETIVGNQVVNLTGSTLIDFLESRRQDGGLATLIIDFPAGASDKSVNYASKENGALDAPMLTLTAIPDTFLSIAGNYTQFAGSTLDIEIGHDFNNTLVVTSTASLSGDLTVSLASGFTPQASDEFLILDADTLVGQFNDLLPDARILTTDGAGSFVVEYDYTNDLVMLTSFQPASLAGDFNDDGFVNAADYSVWRNNLGAAESILPIGSGDGSGTVDSGDYHRWRINYGATSSTSFSSFTVPEPTSMMTLAGLASSLLLPWRFANRLR